MIIGEKVEFLYTGKDGQTTLRVGEVVKNSPSIPAQTHITIRTPEGVYKSFRKDRMTMSTFAYVL
jgi:hypothetical protein